MLWDLLLMLLLLAGGSALDCSEIPGSLRQIDASNGQVFGVNAAGNIYTLHGASWAQLPGTLRHVTVGPAGVWGVDKSNNIYRLVGGTWQQIPGLLKQIDAGGDMFVVGANMNDDIYCLPRGATLTANGSQSWANIAGKLKYYSCGLWGCWGVNSADDIYFRADVAPDPCTGSRWQHVPGKLAMVEVGTDGSIYGVNSAGQIYRRDGVSKSNPVGSEWAQVGSFISKCKHVSYDLGLLWLISDQEHIIKCRV